MSSMVSMKKMWNLEHSHLICACLLCLIFMQESKTAPGKSNSGTFCMFQHKKHQVGDIWNPELEPHGIVRCFECICTERGNVLCMKVKCPTLRCSTPVYDPSKCCPKCPDRPIVSNIRNTGKDCNRTLHHDETFVTEGPFRQPNQCEHCNCTEGKIVCAIKTCPNVTCASPVSTSDSCCQVCKDKDSLSGLDDDLIRQPAIRGARHSPPSQPGSSTSSPRPAAIIHQPLMGRANFRPQPNISPKLSTLVQIILNDQEKVGQVCISNRRTYSHGETWHPVIPFFGPAECVLCTCNSTKPECKPIQCPYHYSCEQPKKIKGRCCKVCTEIESQLPDDQDYFCSVETVYEGVLSTPEGIVRKIALEKNETSEVEVYTWTVKRGILSNVHNIMPKEEFRELTYFRQIMRTTLKKWKIFSAGAAQLNQMCENRECGTELQELLKVLYLEKSEQGDC
ncbi:chordin-like protein 1 isoform X2 [Erythrolamprus reginae]|uniref:chordin-like protein 1 isoform X2 n=1 Tax=Erythrolamprus reginae TaxID=121349 RepID=UPI00396C42FF